MENYGDQPYSARLGFDPGTYGRSFAEVYDSWYPADADTASAVSRISSLAGAAGTILELGVGTGRLALPLVRLGHSVVGMDASREMLALLTDKAGPENSSGRVDPEGRETKARWGDMGCVLGDVANPDDWPESSFDVVVAAFNLVFNLADEAAQKSMFATARSHLTTTGSLIVEAFIPAPIDQFSGSELNLSLRSVSADGVTLIATETDPGTGVVVGQHIELHDGQLPRLRPWRIRVASPLEIDRWAAEAGLSLVERHADWAMGSYSELGTNHVSIYRIAG